MPRNQRARQLDDESGVNRVTPRSKKQPPPPKYSVDTEEESEIDQSDQEVETFREMPQKDDSRRKKGPAPPKAKRQSKTRPLAEGDEEEGNVDKEIDTKSIPAESSSQLFLVGVAYRTGFITKAFPLESTYVPSTHNLFSVVYHINSTINGNSKLHEVCPAYTSMGLTAYYGHAVFYHILRVRNEADLLTRDQRRALRRYESVGPPESWEIAAPLAGFIQALGRIIPEGGKFGQIVPAFPSFAGLSAGPNNTVLPLAHLNASGLCRLPIMSAIQEFLFRYGRNETAYDDDDGILYPVEKTLSATNIFLGLSSSAADAYDFQALAHSAGWNQPHEYEIDTYVRVEAQKRALIRRWGIRAVGTNASLADIEHYLGLEDGRSVTWIKELLKISTAVNRFLPGKTTLAAIPFTTRLENISQVTYTTAAARTLAADKWYHGRHDWTATIEGQVLRDDAGIAYKAALTTSIRAEKANNLLPVEITPSQNGTVSGPYFADETKPRVEIEGLDQPDPIEQVAAFIEAKMYDKEGSA
jgi:hypothetical protein